MQSESKGMGRARLQFMSGSQRGKVVDLNCDRVSVGRDPDNVIRIPDTTVSHHHVLLIWDGVRYKLRDLISTNGTYVNGDRIMDAELTNGDKVWFGAVETRYYSEKNQNVIPQSRPALRPSSLTARIQSPTTTGTAFHVEHPAQYPNENQVAPIIPQTPNVRLLNPDGTLYIKDFEEKGRQRRLFRWFSTARVYIWAVIAAVTIWLGLAYWSSWWPFQSRIFTDPAFIAAGKAEEAEDYKALLKHSEALVDRFPDNPLPYYVMGVAQGQLGDYKNAIAAFQQAIQRDPAYIDAWNNLGWALTREGKLEDAAHAFYQTITFNPEDAQGWSNLGGALARLRRDEEAIEAYEEAIKLRPNYPEAHYNLGIAYASLDKDAEASKAFGRAIELKTDFLEAWLNLGIVSQKRGSIPDAIRCFEQIVQIDPSYPEAWEKLIAAYQNLEQFEKASEAFTELNKINPGRASQLASKLRSSLR